MAQTTFRGMRSQIARLLVLAIAFALLRCGVRASLTPVDLRCDYALDPLGVDSVTPRLFWKLDGEASNRSQSAYQIVAAGSSEDLANGTFGIWDSGKVVSDESIQIPYDGAKLKSSEKVFWKVRIWDGDGNISPWSRSATWTTGILAAEDWRAQWIGAADTQIPSLLLRREFSVKRGLRRALIHICGLGQYELTINGEKVGDDFLSPGWTKYNKTCLYDTYDVSGSLKEGKNAAGIELGNGMYNVLETRFKPPGWQPYSYGPQKAIAQLYLEYADGSVEYVGTDASWRCAAGPITSASIYSGEDFDGRRVQPGWNRTAFDESGWSSAGVVSGPGGALKGLSCAAPPLRLLEVHPSVSERVLGPGDTLFDLGQNAAHVPRISVAGPAGSRFRIIPSELGDGLVSQGSVGEQRGSDIWCDYTKATDEIETWSPKFFYIGCRYLEVKATPARVGGPLPEVKSVSGVVVQSSSSPVGEFECSNALFNRIRTLVRWAQRSNMMSLMTDCPQREKRGWLEQDHLNGPSLRYEYDLAQLFTKTINDTADSQLANGLIPTTAPEYAVFQDPGQSGDQRGMFGDSPEWGSALILVPWQQFEFTGDLELFRRHYDSMKRLVDYLGSRAEGMIVSYGLGDWFDLGPKHPGVAQLTPNSLTATAFYYEDAKILAKAANLLGKSNDAQTYSELEGRIKNAFNAKFYDAHNHRYSTGSQTANSIPLVMGLCEPENRRAVLDSIVEDVRRRGNALTGGDVGYRYLLRALAEGGRSDVIFDINNRSDRPGYGYQLRMGATSLTEAWDAGHDSSQNHFMLGQIQEWFYHDLAGIRSDTNGFKRIVIAPQPVGDITWVRARFDSIRGPISSEWHRYGAKFILRGVIPANTRATIYVPSDSADVKSGPSSRLTGMEEGCAVFEVGPGSFEFASTWRGQGRSNAGD